MKTGRRNVIKSMAMATAGLFVPYTWTAAAKATQMKNDRFNIGLIGAGGRGRFDAVNAFPFGDLVAICDVNSDQFDRTKKLGPQAEKAECYQDYRKLLERKDIDVVIQASTDHWHSKQNIDILQSGRDLYAEKPFAFSIAEGQYMIKVIKESGRVFQLGTQQRSGKQYERGSNHPRPFQEVVELVRNGRIGKLRQVWVGIPYLSMKGGPFKEVPVPASLDWDMFMGQAPVRPYTPFRYHPFRGWYDYCNSMAADWGCHHYDIAHWGMDAEKTGPTHIEARGIFPNEGAADCFDVPDRFFARLQYASGMEVLFFSSMNMRENYGWPVAQHEETSQEKIDWMFGKDVPEEVKKSDRNGVMFIGDKGRVFANRSGVYGKAAEELKENPLPDDAWKASPSVEHMTNFFDCVKSRALPVAGDPVIGHCSLVPCLLTNISMLLDGRPIRWNPEKEEIISDPQASALMAREQRKPYNFM